MGGYDKENTKRHGEIYLLNSDNVDVDGNNGCIPNC